jgi:hypothetical protein
LQKFIFAFREKTIRKYTKIFAKIDAKIFRVNENEAKIFAKTKIEAKTFAKICAKT